VKGKVRGHVLHLDREVVSIELTAEDGFQIFAEPRSAIDVDAEPGRMPVRRTEALDVVQWVWPINKRMCRGAPLTSSIPASRIPIRVDEDDFFSAGDLKARGVPAVAGVLRPDDRNGAASAPELPVTAVRSSEGHRAAAAAADVGEARDADRCAKNRSTASARSCSLKAW